jgi:hypothetical protein
MTTGPVDLRDVTWVLTNCSMAWHHEHDLWSTPVPRVRPTGVSHGWFWGLYSGGTRPTIACGILLPSIRRAWYPGENAASHKGLATWCAGTT